jgi:hypothetical protein
MTLRFRDPLSDARKEETHDYTERFRVFGGNPRGKDHR